MYNYFACNTYSVCVSVFTKFKEKCACIVEKAYLIFMTLTGKNVSSVNRIPPPHLSPFVNYDEEGAYVPDYAKTIKHLQAAARKEILPLPGVGKDLEDPQNLLVKGIMDRAEANEAAKRKQKVCILREQRCIIIVE